MKGYLEKEQYQMAIYGCRRLDKQSNRFFLKGYSNSYFSFSLFYQNLDPDLKLYHKKAILKEKSLIYKKNDEIQVGCQSYQCGQQKQRLFVLIAVTNKGKTNMKIEIETIYQEDLKIQFINDIKNQLMPGQQSRVSFKLNFFDALQHSYPLFRLSYIINKQFKTLSLFLPVSKFKFFRNMVYDSSSLLRPNCIYIVSQFDKDERILRDLSMVQYYFPNTIINRQLTQTHSLFKFRGILYQVTITQDYNHELRVRIYAPKKEKVVAQKFMEDLKFLLSKTQ